MANWRTVRHPITMFIVGVLVVIGIGVGVLEATGTLIMGLRSTTASPRYKIALSGSSVQPMRGSNR